MANSEEQNGRIVNGATSENCSFLVEDTCLNSTTSRVPAVEVVATSNHGRSSWGSRRTTLEKGLLVLTVLFTVIIVISIISLAISLHARGQHSSTSPEVCVTADCVRTASRMLEAMDTTVDPCDDFFQYACGTWNRVNIIPDDKSSYNAYGKLRDDVNVYLKILLEESISDTDSEAIQMTKLFYQSCLNTTEIERRGDTPLNGLLAWLGGWPVLDPNWQEEDFDWIELMAKLRLLHNDILVNSWVSADNKKSDVNIIQLDQANLGMPSRDYYMGPRDDKILVGYETFAKDVARLLGATTEDAEEQMSQVVELEIKLANLTMSMSARRDIEALYNRLTVGELYTNVTRDIDWLRYLNIMLANVSLTINQSEQVVLYNPPYFRDMANLIQRTPKRLVANYLVWHFVYTVYKYDPLLERFRKAKQWILCNYMLWRIIINRVNDLHKPYIDTRQKYFNVIYGTDKERPRWQTCVSYANSNFGMAVGRMFVEKHFNEESKAVAAEMIQNIRDAFKELLDEVDWMKDETKARAKEKANAMQEQIGYPDYILNDTLLSKDYDGIIMHQTKYFENVVHFLNAKTTSNLKNLREPVDKSKWSATPAIVNAYYSFSKNNIVFPAAILQPPFYSKGYPKSLNFGGIAMVIGHEITHGFDDTGRQMDKDGNLQQWWSQEDVDKFKARAQCMIDQYANYTIPEIGLNINGAQTQGENIADNGGLKQSYKAYRNWVSHQGQEEPPLPGLNLTHDQLFFLNFAQLWCGTARPESYLQTIRSGRHSPGEIRVLGVLSNSNDFARTFQCPVGSRMNPEKKCEVW